MWTVRFHPAAERELARLPAIERAAILHAVEKLQASGPALPFPHQSSLKGTEGLRELRPRGGRSAWRVFYRRVGDVLVIVGVGPEAKVDPQGFATALRRATTRLKETEK